MRKPTAQTVRLFLIQAVEPDYENSISVNELFDRWSDWCREKGVWIGSVILFGRHLGVLDYAKTRLPSGRAAYIGLKWKEPQT